MKALTTMFESPVGQDAATIWSAGMPEPQPLAAGPRIQTIWGWGGP